MTDLFPHGHSPLFNHPYELSARARLRAELRHGPAPRLGRAAAAVTAGHCRVPLVPGRAAGSSGRADRPQNGLAGLGSGDDTDRRLAALWLREQEPPAEPGPRGTRAAPAPRHRALRAVGALVAVPRTRQPSVPSAASRLRGSSPHRLAPALTPRAWKRRLLGGGVGPRKPVRNDGSSAGCGSRKWERLRRNCGQ